MPVPGLPGGWPGDVGQQSRTVLLVGTVTPSAAECVAAQIMALDAEPGGAPITLQVAARDGDLAAALMLADVVHLAASSVHAVARGVVGGVAVAPFAAAAHRTGSRAALFHLGEPTLVADPAGGDLPALAAVLARQAAQLHEWIAQATGRSLEAVADDLRSGRVLDAEEALGYGLLHDLLEAPRRGDDGTAPTPED